MNARSTSDCEVIHEDIVNNTLEKMQPREEYMHLASLLKTFADGTRVQILHALAQNEMCVCDLAVLLGVTKSAVSHQLKALRLAKLVKQRREAQVVYYSLIKYGPEDTREGNSFACSVVNLMNRELSMAPAHIDEEPDDVSRDPDEISDVKSDAESKLNACSTNISSSNSCSPGAALSPDRTFDDQISNHAAFASSESHSSPARSGLTINCAFLRLAIGAVIFALGFVMTLYSSVQVPADLPVLLAALVVLCWDTLSGLIKCAGDRSPDADLIIAVSVFGAFAIGDRLKAVAVMLLYKVLVFLRGAVLSRAKVLSDPPCTAADIGASASSPTEKFASALSRYYTTAAAFFALCAALVPPLLFGGEWLDSLRRAFVLLAVSSPCAIAISVPLAFRCGVCAQAAHGTVIRGQGALEALAGISTVVFDDMTEPELRKVIASLKLIGVQKTVLLTESDEKTGKATAKYLSFDECFTQLLPGQKPAVLDRLMLQNRGRGTVAYVGAADSSALFSAADVGICVGGANEAADVILKEGGVLPLVKSIEIARSAKGAALHIIIVSLAVKLVLLILSVLGIAEMWMAVLCDTCVSLITVFNSLRLLKTRVK